MKKLILIICFSLFLTNANIYSQTTGFVDDTSAGTEVDPIEISTVNDLIYLSHTLADWNKYFIQTADIDFGADETAVDWDKDGTADGSGTAGFSPIGNSSDDHFAGNYDGQNYTIDNLYIDRPSTDAGIGLFGNINGASLSNLGVTNVDITFLYFVFSNNAHTFYDCLVTLANCHFANCQLSHHGSFHLLNQNLNSGFKKTLHQTVLFFGCLFFNYFRNTEYSAVPVG